MGVCKVVSEGGLLSGFLSIRFIVIFLACLCTMFVKFYVSVGILPFPVPLLTLPGLITGVTFTWHRTLFKTFLKHPSLLLLPAFSFFTFESNTKKCCQRKDNLPNEVEIRFSVKGTFFNILFTLVGVIVLAFIAPHVGTPLPCDQTRSALECSLILLPESVFHFLLGILFTTIFLLCCICPTNCSCTSPSFCFFSCSVDSSCSCFPPLEFGVYKPSSSDKVFVIDQWSKEVKEVKEFALEEDQADSEERGEMPNEGEEEEEV